MADKEAFALRGAVSSLEFSPTLGVNEQVRAARLEGRAVFHLEFGQSPFPVQAAIRSALQANAGENQYLPAAGLPALRNAARHYYAVKLGLVPKNYQVATLPGTAFGDDAGNLRLRLAPCDYDGQAALDGYAADPESLGGMRALEAVFCWLMVGWKAGWMLSWKVGGVWDDGGTGVYFGR